MSKQLGNIASDGAIPTTTMIIPMPAGTKPPPPAPTTSKK